MIAAIVVLMVVAIAAAMGGGTKNPATLPTTTTSAAPGDPSTAATTASRRGNRDDHTQSVCRIRITNDGGCSSSSSSRGTATGREDFYVHPCEIFPRNDHIDHWTHHKHLKHHSGVWCDKHHSRHPPAADLDWGKFNDLDISIVAA